MALHLEHQFFGQDAFATTGQERGRPGARRAGEDLVRRLGEQLQPLSDRANRMFIRNLKAIKELRQGLVPAIAIGPWGERRAACPGAADRRGEVVDSVTEGDSP